MAHVQSVEAQRKQDAALRLDCTFTSLRCKIGFILGF